MTDIFRYITGVTLVLFISSLLIISFIGVGCRLPGPLEKSISVFISPGMKTVHIASLLERENVIHNKFLMLIYLRWRDKITSIKAGEYEFTPRMSMLEVLHKLIVGESVVHKFVVPEGLTVFEIVKLLNSESKLAGEISEIPGEGSLFPSTYYFTYGDLRSSIINMMRVKMSEALLKLTPEIYNNPDIQSVIKNERDLLTLASIVEKEAMYDDEKPKIARVFINRLHKKMRLQSCPTTIYAITQGKYVLERPVNFNDLKLKSDFNTYYIVGLPKTPISCPGIKSLEAVVRSVKSDDLYFVTRGDGRHHFSPTFHQHKQHKLQKHKK